MTYRKTIGRSAVALMLAFGLQACQQADNYEAEYQPRPGEAKVEAVEAQASLETALGHADMRIDSLETVLQNAEAVTGEHLKQTIEELRAESAKLGTQIDSLNSGTETELKAKQDSLRVRLDMLEKAIDRATAKPADSMK